MCFCACAFRSYSDTTGCTGGGSGGVCASGLGGTGSGREDRSKEGPQLNHVYKQNCSAVTKSHKDVLSLAVLR